MIHNNTTDVFCVHMVNIKNIYIHIDEIYIYIYIYIYICIYVYIYIYIYIYIHNIPVLLVLHSATLVLLMFLCENIFHLFSKCILQ